MDFQPASLLKGSLKTPMSGVNYRYWLLGKMYIQKVMKYNKGINLMALFSREVQVNYDQIHPENTVSE